MEHNEICEATWETGENKRLPHVKNDVLLTAFYHARHTMAVEKLTGFEIKK